MHGHRLIRGVEHALGWAGPSALGTQLARGKLPDPELVTRLLTPRRLLDVLMRRSLSPPQVRCLTNGTELHPRDYTAETTSRRGQTIPMVDMHHLGHLLESGCTLIVDAINRWDATMDVACRSWQWWSRERVQANTYLTTQDTSGFTLHWDDHDVIIVQLDGEKSWDVRTPSRPVPTYRDATPNSERSNERVWSGTLTAGDVMRGGGLRDRLPTPPTPLWRHHHRAQRGKKLTVAAKAEPALRMLLCGQPVDLAAVSDAARVDAAKLETEHPGSLAPTPDPNTTSGTPHRPAARSCLALHYRPRRRGVAFSCSTSSRFSCWCWSLPALSDREVQPNLM
jgi:JmjC domain